MDSYLENRPKVDPSSPFGGGLPADGLAYRDPLEGVDSFMAGLPQTGGFQSLKSALLEAGSIVDPADAHAPRRGGAQGGAGGEPSVEVITNEGRIEKVVVTCACCRKIELECSY